ncbi:four helix bundle protein [Fodinibius sp. SL11]|uniref:four helix bundle protein n=1 Tax=Fodinibius sp. SL11 TaxID=3425690 RepID=UPI003F882335
MAEGAGRNTNKDFKRFLSIAYGSSYELETQLIISKNLELISNSKSEKLCTEIEELQKMLYTLAQKLV